MCAQLLPKIRLVIFSLLSVSCRLCHPKGFQDPQPWKRRAELHFPPGSCCFAPHLFLVPSPDYSPPPTSLAPPNSFTYTWPLPPLSSSISKTFFVQSHHVPHTNTIPSLSSRFYSSHTSCTLRFTLSPLTSSEICSLPTGCTPGPMATGGHAPEIDVLINLQQVRIIWDVS